MADVSPAAILAQVAEAIPQDCRDRFVVIGSLAAGYFFFGHDDNRQVRTKDIDSVLIPHDKATGAGKDIAERLLSCDWTHRTGFAHDQPGGPATPENKLPVIRLCPPDSRDWYLELLSDPKPGQGAGRVFSRVALSTGHYALVSFRFLSVTTFKPSRTPLGIHCARPSMMALANLLEHPRIGSERMSEKIGGRSIKRSNKDLGRVLALARLIGPETFEARWADDWREAVTTLFPEDSSALLSSVGDGLAAQLSSPSDLEEAVHSCNHGLLSDAQVTEEQLHGTGQQLMTFVVNPLDEK